MKPLQKAAATAAGYLRQLKLELDFRGPDEVPTVDWIERLHHGVQHRIAAHRSVFFAGALHGVALGLGLSDEQLVLALGDPQSFRKRFKTMRWLCRHARDWTEDDLFDPPRMGRRPTNEGASNARESDAVRPHERRSK